MGGRAAATIPSVSTVGHDSSWLARGRLWFNRLNQNRPGVLVGAAQARQHLDVRLFKLQSRRDRWPPLAGAPKMARHEREPQSMTVSKLDWADIVPAPVRSSLLHHRRSPVPPLRRRLLQESPHQDQADDAGDQRRTERKALPPGRHPAEIPRSRASYFSPAPILDRAFNSAMERRISPLSGAAGASLKYLS